jgi:DNA repair protein RadC
VPEEKSELLRDRVRRLGPEQMDAAELLALMLGGGAQRSVAPVTANWLLRQSGGLAGLARMAPATFLRMKHLDRRSGARLCGALEFYRRLHLLAAGEDLGEPITDPAVAAALLFPRLAHKRREHFGVLLLDSRNRLERQAIISVGSLNGSLVHPREVFREALIHAAASLILFHNHPSGDPTPSREDVAITGRLLSAGSLVGVEVLDHLVIGRGRFTSMKEQGLM